MAYYSLTELANNLIPTYAEDLDNLNLADDKSLFGAAVDYGLATNFTVSGVNFLKDVLGNEEKLTPEAVQKEYGVKIERPLTITQLNYKLKVDRFEKQLALQLKDHNNLGGKSVVLLGQLAAGFIDPAAIALSLTGIGIVSQGLRAANATKIIAALNSTSFLTRVGARASTFGVTDSVLNVGVGKAIVNSRGKEYTGFDYAVDATFGFLFGSLIPVRSVSKTVNKKVLDPEVIDVDPVIGTKATKREDFGPNFDDVESLKRSMHKVGERPTTAEWNSPTFTEDSKTLFSIKVLQANGILAPDVATISRTRFLLDIVFGDKVLANLVFGDSEVGRFANSLKALTAHNIEYVDVFHRLKDLLTRDSGADVAPNGILSGLHPTGKEAEVSINPVKTESVNGSIVPDVTDSSLDISVRTSLIDEVIAANRIIKEGDE